jgi:hypothetical protein
MIRLGITISLIAAPALAQDDNCGPREAVARWLAEEYREQQVALGMGAGGEALEVWASPETGTFTVLRTSAAGVACIVADGTGWTYGAAENKGPAL